MNKSAKYFLCWIFLFLGGLHWDLNSGPHAYAGTLSSYPLSHLPDLKVQNIFILYSKKS
jgi:hypothetical protein